MQTDRQAARQGQPHIVKPLLAPCPRPPPSGLQGGVLRRPGHTEASVDLCRLAACQPAGVLCEIVNDDGTMARTPELLKFAAQHGLKVITIADLIRYRLKHDRLVECTAVTALPTRWVAREGGGDCQLYCQGAGTSKSWCRQAVD